LSRFGSALYHGCLNAPKKKLHPLEASEVSEKSEARLRLWRILTNPAEIIRKLGRAAARILRLNRKKADAMTVTADSRSEVFG
jgi:hypothetical protein